MLLDLVIDGGQFLCDLGLFLFQELQRNGVTVNLSVWERILSGYCRNCVRDLTKLCPDVFRTLSQIDQNTHIYALNGRNSKSLLYIFDLDFRFFPACIVTAFALQYWWR